ncbi:Ribosomal RNA small subunit methyltransferase D [bacterium HR39]|nr:Ribosomal RNA small subunit methyltransferase D [bacterium HR39]
MRITTGRLRGRRLHTVPGHDVRPTREHARRALFDILTHGRPRLVGARFLDVFAGSGAIGLEAWSRGARRVLLVENAPAAVAVIRRNLHEMPLDGGVELFVADATDLPRAPHPFDIAFLDPPYRSGLAVPALESLHRRGWLVPGARVVVELAKTEDLPEVEGYTVEDIRRYGAAKFVFLRYVGDAGQPHGEGDNAA